MQNALSIGGKRLLPQVLPSLGGNKLDSGALQLIEPDRLFRDIQPVERQCIGVHTTVDRTSKDEPALGAPRTDALLATLDHEGIELSLLQAGEGALDTCK